MAYRWDAHTEVTAAVDDESHGADVDRADRVGRWVDVDPAFPVYGEGERAKG